MASFPGSSLSAQCLICFLVINSDWCRRLLITCFVFIGRFDLFKHKVVCADCSYLYDPFNIEMLLKSGFWPGGVVNINYLVQEDVFIIWDVFRKRMPGSSQKSFLMSLNDVAYERGWVRETSLLCRLYTLAIPTLIFILWNSRKRVVRTLWELKNQSDHTSFVSIRKMNPICQKHL